MQRLTTRSRATAEAIRDRESFDTSGSMRGRVVDAMSRWDYGPHNSSDGLDQTNRDQFQIDCDYIDYMVWSYAAPIAWHWTNEAGESGWHVVNQKWSRTTTKHQGNLYLIPRENASV